MSSNLSNGYLSNFPLNLLQGCVSQSSKTCGYLPLQAAVGSVAATGSRLVYTITSEFFFKARLFNRATPNYKLGL